MNRDEFDNALSMLEEFHGEELNDIQRTVWWQQFQNQTIDMFDAAIQRHFQRDRDKRMPMPSGINEHIDSIRTERALRHGPSPVAPAKVGDGYTDSEAWELEAAIIGETLEWHRACLVQPQKSECELLDIEKWAELGQPKTWSPIIDTYLKGLWSIWHNGNSAHKQYMASYLSKLRKTRQERCAEREKAHS